MPNGVFHIPCTMVTSLQGQDFHSPEFSLMDLCCDYIHSSLRMISKECFTSTWQSSHQLGSNIADVSRVLEYQQANEFNHKCLVYSRESITKYLAQQNEAVQSKWSPIIRDYDALIKNADRLGAEIQARLQIMLNSTAIEEARRGLGQADSIKRLTVIALVFIPLSFASSVLGMNVKEIDGSDVGIKHFFLVAAISGFLAYLISASIVPLQKLLLSARRNHIIRHRPDVESTSEISVFVLFLYLPLDMWRYSLYIVREPWYRAREAVARERGTSARDISFWDAFRRMCFISWRWVIEAACKLIGRLTRRRKFDRVDPFSVAPRPTR
ncbi:hypothetical protein BKA64DRAFT_408053 [Cadophora sp. MPI-SDFR-AT-0126]|nr:hypothetical protein BKA64DRAFT_408053 [Leotiomycetes sp. MPI-SDFR-AT-0126]